MLKSIAPSLRIAFCALYALVLLVGMAGPAQSQDRYAVLIASGDYAPSVPYKSLPGVRNDVALMLTLLRHKHGMDPQHILVVGLGARDIPFAGAGCKYADQPATRASIQQGFNWLRQQLDAHGGTGIIYYTGHGSSLYNRNRYIPSSSTQYLIDHDGNPVFDFEIHGWLRKMEKHALTLIFDCCYARGMAREFSFSTPKATAPDPARAKPLLDSLMPAAIRDNLLGEEMLPPSSHHVLLGASAGLKFDEQPSAQMLNYKDVQVSAFTLALYRYMMRAPRPASLSQIRDGVHGELRNMACEQVPLLQVPSLQGNHRGSDFGDFPDRPLRLPVEAGRIPIGTQTGGDIGLVLRNSAPGLGRETVSRVQITHAGTLYSTVTPVGAGAVPEYVTLENAPALPKSAAYRVPIKASPLSKGDNPQPVQLFPDEKDADWVVNMIGPAGNGAYKVQASSHDGLTGPVYTASSEEEARRKAQELQRWLETLGVLRNFQNPLRPMGLQITTGRGPAPTYRLGEEFNVTVSTERGGYLLLLGLEQDGKVDVFYPNQEKSDYRLEAAQPVALPLQAAPPAGETTVVAFLCTRPLNPPGECVEAGRGGVHWVVMPEKRDAFLRWLSDALHKTTEDAPRATRDLITPAKGTALATAFDTQALVVRVQER